MKKTIYNGLFYGIIILVLCTSVMYVVRSKTQQGQPPSVWGIIPLRIESGSMEPTFPVDSYVFTTKQKAYEVGDVISFRRNEEGTSMIVTHRIVAADNGQFQTQGDNNGTPDMEKVSPADILGKVVFYFPFPLLTCLFVIVGAWVLYRAFLWLFLLKERKKVQI